MNRCGAMVPLVLLTLVCQPLLAATPGVDESELSRHIDALISPWDRDDTPGVAVLVQEHGSDVYRACVGTADLGLGVPIGPETMFDFASVSKHMTGFAVLLLDDAGKLSLDDGVRDYLPELPVCAEPVRIRHLLYQSSGLWEFWTILTKYTGFHRRDYIRMADVLKLLAGQTELTFEPGSGYSYTNTNYSLLSLVVERAGGEPFGKWMHDNVFKPLGMDDSMVQMDCTELIPHRATAYLKARDGYRLARPSNVEIPGSAHTFTNLDDMSRWLANFRDRKLGGEVVFGKLTTPGVLNDGSQMHYAAGLIVDVHAGAEIIAHSGQTGGYKTMLIYCPDRELGIVVLANERAINAHGIAYDILEFCLGVEQEKTPETAEEDGSPPEPFRAPEGLVARYTGGYRLEGEGQLIGMHPRGNRLFASIEGLGSEYFDALSETEFSDRSGQVTIDFEVDPSGRVLGLSLTLGGNTQQAKRIQTAARSVPEPEFAGVYRCAALGSVCEIVVEQERLLLKHRRYDPIELYRVDRDRFLGGWGFIGFQRDGNDVVDAFLLSAKLFGWQPLRFVRVVD